jgi:hypothetical protein
MLKNPVHAGGDAFGRTESRVRIEHSRKRIVRGYQRAREHWQVLITEHHEGYIDRATYEPRVPIALAHGKIAQSACA